MPLPAIIIPKPRGLLSKYFFREGHPLLGSVPTYGNLRVKGRSIYLQRIEGPK